MESIPRRIEFLAGRCLRGELLSKRRDNWKGRTLSPTRIEIKIKLSGRLADKLAKRYDRIGYPKDNMDNWMNYGKSNQLKANLIWGNGPGNS